MQKYLQWRASTEVSQKQFHMSETKVEQAYHPNGQLRWQATIRDGKPVGMVRHWHENSVVQRECPCEEEGLAHGIVKDWNNEGKLLGKSYMDHGTGIVKHWFANDQLSSEGYCVRGKRCGRSRFWLEDGTLMSVTYYMNGRE